MLKAVLRDSFIYSLGSLLSKGLVIFLLPLYASVLSPRDYGAYDLLITLGVLINLTIALEVSQGIGRFWNEVPGVAGRRRLASTSLWFTVIVYLVFFVAGMLAAPKLNAWILGDDGYLDAFRLGVGFVAVNGVYLLLLKQFRWELRSKAYTGVGVLYALLTLFFASAFCLMMQMGLVGVMLAQLLAALAGCVWSIWLLRHTYGWTFDLQQLRAILFFSAPLVPAGLALFVSLYISRLALNYFGALEDVGYFSIGSRISGVAALLIVGVQAALAPLVYKHHDQPQTPTEIARLFGWFMAVALNGCLFLVLFAKEFVVFFASSEFIESAKLVSLLAPALVLSQMYIFAPGIAISKKMYLQLWVALLSAVVSVLGNWLFVPLWGGVGAALATLSSSVVFFLFWLFLSQRLYRIPYAWRAVVPATISFVVCVMVGALFDGLGLSFLMVVFFKLLLLLFLSCVVVFCGLLSVQDLRVMFLKLRVFLGFSARG